MFVFYDFEVFEYDWLVVLIEMPSHTITKIHNDSKAFSEYCEKHNKDIWVGYNNTHYDVFIKKAILLGINPKEVNDRIIGGEKGWQISREFNKVSTIEYDAMLPMRGLKQLEGYQGKNIFETNVPFDITRPLTDDELNMTFEYCYNDVVETINVFMNNKTEFDAHVSLIKTFKLPMNNLAKTKAQLSALILGCSRMEFNDEWDIQIVDTLRLKKYDYVREWFLNNRGDYGNKLTTEINGIPHVFGWGGIHGAIKQYHSKGLLLHVDVNSYYPSLMIEYDFLTRTVRNKEKFKNIRDTRIEYKKTKDPRQAPYKIVINSTYGISKDKYNIAYDPRQANNVCVNGQLLLLDLIEHAESVPGCKLIQSNTDGLIYELEDERAKKDLIEVCHEWEERTRMGLGYDDIDEIWQKDVNNYIFRFSNGKLERKGGYVKELTPFDYDLPIVNIALVDYMTQGTAVETTIKNHTELICYQKIVKLSNKYEYVEHGNNKYSNKSYRVFAVTTNGDNKIYKCKTVGGLVQKHKFANTPNDCVIINGDVTNMTVNDVKNFDTQYYIDVAKKRLSEFGVI